MSVDCVVSAGLCPLIASKRNTVKVAINAETIIVFMDPLLLPDFVDDKSYISIAQLGDADEL